MPTTTNGIVYPDSTGHTRLWEHFQDLADSADAAIVAAVDAVFQPTVLKKGSTQSVTNSATYVDDATFQITLPAGTYWIDLYLSVSGPAAADFKCRWAFSGTAGSTARSQFGPALTTTHAPATAAAATTVGNTRATVDAYTADGRYGTDGSNASAIHENLYFEVVSSGLLKLQWAQDTANASSTNVAAASRMRVDQTA